MSEYQLLSKAIRPLGDKFHGIGDDNIEKMYRQSASGAAANPFVTHHNDFDTDMYLRIAPEIALKIATVG